MVYFYGFEYLFHSMILLYRFGVFHYNLTRRIHKKADYSLPL
jgi:hypothetical protein